MHSHPRIDISHSHHVQDLVTLAAEQPVALTWDGNDVATVLSSEAMNAIRHALYDAGVDVLQRTLDNLAEREKFVPMGDVLAELGVLDGEGT